MHVDMFAAIKLIIFVKNATFALKRKTAANCFSTNHLTYEIKTGNY